MFGLRSSTAIKRIFGFLGLGTGSVAKSRKGIKIVKAKLRLID
jgi:hypothetical protein